MQLFCYPPPPRKSGVFQMVHVAVGLLLLYDIKNKAFIIGCFLFFLFIFFLPFVSLSHKRYLSTIFFFIIYVFLFCFLFSDKINTGFWIQLGHS